MNQLKTNDSIIAYFLWAYRTSNQFLYYANLTIVPIGLFCNLISFLIFSKKSFRIGTMGYFFKIIAIMDSIVLINLFLNFFSQSLEKDIVLISDFYCKFFNLALRVSFQSSSWLNVLVTLDRLLSIKYHHKQFKFNKNKKILTLILLGALLLIILINSPNLFMNLKVYDYENQTIVLCTSDLASNNYREIVHIIMRTALPFTIMLTANLNLIKAVKKSRLKLKKEKSLKREYYFASSLIIMNSYFLANLIPLELSKILASIFSSQISIFSGIITIIYFVATYVSAFNHVFPFFINLKFNKIFYNEFRQTIYQLNNLFILGKSSKKRKVNYNTTMCSITNATKIYSINA